VNRARSHWRRRRRMPAVGLDPAAGFLDRLESPNGDLAREWDRLDGDDSIAIDGEYLESVGRRT